MPWTPAVQNRSQTSPSAFSHTNQSSCSTKNPLASCFLLLHSLLILLGLSICSVHAQTTILNSTDNNGNQKQIPVDLTSDSGTSIQSGILVAHSNVVLYYGDVTIYCDHIYYNQSTHDAIVAGHVRIYQTSNPGTKNEKQMVVVTDRAVYNLDTHELRTAKFAADKAPFEIEGDAVYSPPVPNGSTSMYNIVNASITTSDTTKPDWQLKAKHIRLYPDDRIILSNVTMYVGNIPISWFPYLYQSLNNQFSYNIIPGQNGTFGAYLMTSVTFPAPFTQNLEATPHLDYYQYRGPAAGLDLSYEKTVGNNHNHFKFSSYFINDQQADLNTTSLGREHISSGRYRVQLQGQYYLSNDLSVLANIEKLSDPYFVQDFYPFQYQYNPAPDNFVELQQKGEAYTLNALVRFQANNFFETVERLPDISWNVARTPLAKTGIFFEQTIDASLLHRAFANSTLGDLPMTYAQFQQRIQGVPNGTYNTLNNTYNIFNPDLQEFRLDSFQQFTYPKTYFGWLSIVPRLGFRTTFYSQTGEADIKENAGNSDLGVYGPYGPYYVPGSVHYTGPGVRFSVNAGLEASFKIQRSWENVQSHFLGLEGLRHIIQPYIDYSYVTSPIKPDHLLPMDQLLPGNTAIPPIDFPDFNASDSINQWSILRLGVRNRLQTRRGDTTINWLSLDTYFDINFQDPFDPTHQFSELVNQLQFNPVPWLGLGIFAQIPVFDSNGFTEVNTYINWTVTPQFQLQLSDLVLQHNPDFSNSNAVTVNAYYKLNENWGFSVFEQFEAATQTWQRQGYWIHRDLSSWVGSFGVIADNNGGGKRNIGVQLMFTLKALPQRSFHTGDSQEY
jgi:LPS-assembly protein